MVNFRLLQGDFYTDPSKDVNICPACSVQTARYILFFWFWKENFEYNALKQILVKLGYFICIYEQYSVHMCVFCHYIGTALEFLLKFQTGILLHSSGPLIHVAHLTNPTKWPKLPDLSMLGC